MELTVSTQNIKAQESEFVQAFLEEKLKHLQRFFGEGKNSEALGVKARIGFLPHRHTYTIHLETHLKHRNIEYTSEGRELQALLRTSWRQFERTIIEEWKKIRKRWTIARKHEIFAQELELKRWLSERKALEPTTILSQIRGELLTLWKDLTEFARHELYFHEHIGELPGGHFVPSEVVDEAILELLEGIRRYGEPPEDLNNYLKRAIRRKIGEEIVRQGFKEFSLSSEYADSSQLEEDPDLLPEVLKEELEKRPELEKPYLEIFTNLPPRDRALVRLYMDQDRTLKDLARIYGISIEELERKVGEVTQKIASVRREIGVIS